MVHAVDIVEAASGVHSLPVVPSQAFELDEQLCPTLAQLGRNLTARAASGGIDPVIGREAEVDRLLDILARRRGNNPVLVGPAGVGKTSVVEALALRLVAGNSNGGIYNQAPDEAAVDYNDAHANDLHDYFFNVGYGTSEGGIGNLSADPRFADADGGDYTLLDGFSPCIDAGNPLSGYNDADGTRNDMGAYGGPAGVW